MTKTYNNLKSAALFEKQDRNGRLYYSVQAEMPDGSKWSALVFHNRDAKPGQPAFKSFEPKLEKKSEPESFDQATLPTDDVSF